LSEPFLRRPTPFFFVRTFSPPPVFPSLFSSPPFSLKMTKGFFFCAVLQRGGASFFFFFYNPRNVRGLSSFFLNPSFFTLPILSANFPFFPPPGNRSRLIPFCKQKFFFFLSPVQCKSFFPLLSYASVSLPPLGIWFAIGSGRFFSPLFPRVRPFFSPS